MRRTFCFDLEVQQIALTDEPLTVHEYHYGGLALRGPAEWIVPKAQKENATLEKTKSWFLNDQGSDRLKGNHQHSKWVSLSGKRKTALDPS